MKRRSFKTQNTSIGAAMADMAMLLLIFFMVTTNAEPPQGVEVELPEATTQQNKGDSIYITIGSTGEYFFEGKKTELKKIQSQLSFRPDEKDKTIAISAEESIDYQYVGALLTKLREVDFLNILFVSQDKKENL
jgi:biopolymer transport protein ExbD